MSYIGPKVHIDLHQLKKNYQLVKSEVGEIPIMATVKANAYGHGAIKISKALEEEGVSYLAVFTIDEGQIKEALADKMYDAFFNSAALSGLYIEDIKSLQTTISEGQVATGRLDDSDPLIFYNKEAFFFYGALETSHLFFDFQL